MKVTDKITIINECNMELMKRYPDNYFAPIKEWEHYLIGKSGEVFNTRTQRFKKACKDYKGYMRIRLIDGRNNGATKKIHRLVAQAFISDYSESLQVNHKNCIKDDNRLDNLEMVTQSQNIKHAWKNNRMKLNKKK